MRDGSDRPAGGERGESLGLEWKEVRKGTHPGDRFIRLARHEHFRKLGEGRYEIRAAATAPRGGLAMLVSRLKRLVIGEPLATAQAGHERLTKLKALAVLSSDALSSVAYATEEIMRVLLLAGAAALGASLGIGAVIVALLFVVGFSYRQTVRAYPTGGGSYIVAKDNLGTLPGLAAAASLLISYVLTVAVSVAAGVEALASAYPSLTPHKVAIGVVVIVVVTLVNLRGIRESGSIFMLPTYAFLVSISAMLVVGLWRFGFGPPAEPAVAIQAAQPLTLFLLLRAFASGGAALTGVEAISDGVPAFQPPEWKNAQKTLTAMVVILAITFSGITYLANRVGAVPGVSEGSHANETVVSQIARAVFGDGAMYYAIQYATFLILFLAANTAYSDFPRLAYFLGRDRFLPHQFTFRGDRLAFTVGIVVLGVASAFVLSAFGGEISALIPLYAFGVFSAFTLSQSGMVMRWWRRREPGWQTSIVFNGIGAAATFVVLLVVATTKFLDGAWMVVVLLPLHILMFRAIHRHYARTTAEMAAETPIDPDQIRHTVIVPIASLNQVALQTLAYARSIARDADDVVVAVHVSETADDAEHLRAQWQEWESGVELVIIESPYRSLIGPVLAYIDSVQRQRPQTTVSVVLPEMVPSHWWEQILHNQSALRLKAALLFRPGIVVTSVPYHLKRSSAMAAPASQTRDGRADRTAGPVEHAHANVRPHARRVVGLPAPRKPPQPGTS